MPPSKSGDRTFSDRLLGAIVVLFVRCSFIYARRQQVTKAFYLIVVFLVFCLTMFQGWYGGEMVYSQGAGVATAGKGSEKLETGKRRLDSVT